MVIQRRRAAGSGPSIAPLESTNQISSSDESDGSWDNQVGLHLTPRQNYSSIIMHFKKQKSEDLEVLRTINERLTRSRSSEGGARGSLDLLRVNLQSSFDMEVAELVQKYKEKFFEKAYRNLRSSLGEHALSDEDVSTIVFCRSGQHTLQYYFNSLAPGRPSEDGSRKCNPIQRPVAVLVCKTHIRSIGVEPEPAVRFQ